MNALGNYLFAPRSVAIVGSSDDAEKAAGRPLRFLRQAGFRGTVYPVNERLSHVQGERAWASLKDLPECPDHVFIVTSTESAIHEVELCGRLGIPVATVLANGFSEVGPEGQVREQRLREICRKTGIRVVGPSSLGLVNVRNRLLLTGNAAFAEPNLSPGGIFVASQSGSLIGALLSRGKARGIGFAGFASVGNEVDLGIGEICQSTLDDPTITGYLLFLESIRHAGALRSFAEAAHRLGRPVVAYKLGRSAEASELAQSHTGAMSGEDDVASAFLASCGIARVDTFDGLIEALPLASRVSVRDLQARKPQVCVVTTTGGGAAMVVDQLALRGLSVVQPSAETFAALAVAGVTVAPGRIVDLTLAGARPHIMTAALKTLLAAPEIDLLMTVVGSSARLQPELAVRPVIACAGSGKPLAAYLVPDAPEALQMFTDAGIPNFRSPESCADAVAAILGRKSPIDAMAWQHAPLEQRSMLDESASYAVLDRAGIAHAPAVVIEGGCSNIPDLPFPYPVAAKILSSQLAHKSDIGGVALDLADKAQVLAAMRSMIGAARQARPDLKVQGVLLQPMTRGIAEVLVGYRVDEHVGPIVMLAMGGTLAEIYRDRSLRMAPVDEATAWQMIDEVRGLSVLNGYRGKPAGDRDALARMIVAVSSFARQSDIVEAEMNPVLVKVAGEGVMAVDAVVHLAIAAVDEVSASAQLSDADRPMTERSRRRA